MAAASQTAIITILVMFFSSTVSLHPAPYTLHPTPYTPHTPHPTPHTPHPTPYTIYTLHPTTYTLHPTLKTLNPEPYSQKQVFGAKIASLGNYKETRQRRENAEVAPPAPGNEAGYGYSVAPYGTAYRSALGTTRIRRTTRRQRRENAEVAPY